MLFAVLAKWPARWRIALAVGLLMGAQGLSQVHATSHFDDLGTAPFAAEDCDLCTLAGNLQPPLIPTDWCLGVAPSSAVVSHAPPPPAGDPHHRLPGARAPPLAISTP